MRVKILAITPALAFAITALAAHDAAATDVPMTCTTQGDASVTQEGFGSGNFTITVTGPFRGPCSDYVPGDLGTECTRLHYSVVPKPSVSTDHVTVLATYDSDIVPVNSNENTSIPCEGDTVTGLGVKDCSTRTLRVNPMGSQPTFDLVVRGSKSLTTGAIALKKGKAVEGCRIASLGTDRFDKYAQRTEVQVLTFKGCTVSIPTDPVTGEGGDATITGGENCQLIANGDPVSSIELLHTDENGTQSLGMMTYGEGAISSGANSCTTKVISNRIYTWCTCSTGDPSPPCP